MGRMERVIFGKVTMYRHFCKKCKQPILSNDSYYKCDCCGYSNKNEKIKRTVIEAKTKRYRPSARIQKEIIEKQNNKCYWCGRDFSTPIVKNDKIKFLKKHWDHVIPYAYEQRNRDENWVLSCNICNLFKSSFLFETETKCREYINNKWGEYLRKGMIGEIN